MPPHYLHCPHCGFPAVVRVAEMRLSRRCRQCAERYVPGLVQQEQQADDRRHATNRSRHVARAIPVAYSRRRRSAI